MSQIEGKVGWFGPNKRGEGYRLVIGETWYTTGSDFGGQIAKGNTIKAIVADEDGEQVIRKAKLISKAAPQSGGGKKWGGGGGRKPNPEAEKRYAEQAKREAERWSHQLTIVEPRISYANARDHALRYLDLLIRTEAFSVGATAAKRAGLLDAKLQELTDRFYAASTETRDAVPVTPPEQDEFNDEPAADNDESEEDWGDDDDFE